MDIIKKLVLVMQYYYLNQCVLNTAQLTQLFNVIVFYLVNSEYNNKLPDRGKEILISKALRCLQDIENEIDILS